MAVDKPNIEVIDLGGVNQWINTGLPKIALVAHIMQGTLDGCISWFKDPAAQASSNYGVGKDGRIVQFVDPFGTNCPYANGIVDNPDATAIALLKQEQGANPNYFTISIEHEGNSGDVMPPTQLAASGHLAAWLIEQFNIAFDEDHLTGHYEWDSVTRAGCPGWNRAGWTAWEDAIAAALATPAPTPAPAPEPGPVANIPSAIARLQSAQGLRAQAAAIRLQAGKDLAAADALDAQVDVDIEAAKENITVPA